MSLLIFFLFFWLVILFSFTVSAVQLPNAQAWQSLFFLLITYTWMALFTLYILMASNTLENSCLPKFKTYRFNSLLDIVVKRHRYLDAGNRILGIAFSQFFSWSFTSQQTLSVQSVIAQVRYLGITRNCFFLPLATHPHIL